MKQKKQKRPPNRLRAIKGNPLFGQRVEVNKKGKGSYRREKLKSQDYGKSDFKENISTIILGLEESNDDRPHYAIHTTS